MKPERLDTLADGIFAIVMTLLVIEIRVPEISGIATNEAVGEALRDLGPLIMSYILSFAVLFTYWRAHHFIMGVYAKTVDTHLMNINALFFLFVAFVPFTSALLGLYNYTQVAVVVYAANVILIGITIAWMRWYVLFTDYIESAVLDRRELRHGKIRTFVPVVFAALAIPISFWSTLASLILLTCAVMFNLLRHSTRATDWVLGYGPHE